MTLQERVLEALGERALKPQALYTALKGDQPAALDLALRALMRSGAVTLELGHYQREKRAAPPAPQAAPTFAAKTHSAAVVSIDRKSVGRELTRREREIFGLLESGASHQEIAQQLGISRTCVSAHLSTARGKLGLKAPAANGKISQPQPAPAAAAVQKAAPSREGASLATVGADPPWFDKNLTREPSFIAAAPQGFERKRPPFSPDLIYRLVEQQRSKAMFVQMLCEKLSMARQDLADIEELVRIATEGGRNA